MAHIKLFNHYLQTPYLLLGLLEFAVLVAAAHAGFYIRFGPEVVTHFDWASQWMLRAVVFAVAMLACTAAMGVYPSRLREGFTSMAVRTVVSYCLLGSMALILLYYLVPHWYIGRGVLLVAVLVALAVVLPLRFLFFAAVGIEPLRRRVLLVGTGHRAQQLLDTLDKDRAQLGVEIVGCIEAGGTSVVNPALRRRPPENWLEMVRRERISEIVVVMDERRRGQGALFPLADLLDCKLAGVRVIEAINFYERETGRIELDLLNPGWMLFSDGFRYSQPRDVAKRIFDVLISLLLLLLTWPLMLIAVVGILLESGRPVIYRQIRVGLNGKPFELLKFRSMIRNAEQHGAQWAAQNDSRITRFGHFMRNTRIDELPQLYNVLRGQMSFIGPRPERPEFVCDLVEKIPYYDARHRVKPGLMGWAQLKYPYGASMEDAAEKLRYDLYYTKNHSLLLDMVIVVQTVEVILLGKGVR